MSTLNRQQLLDLYYLEARSKLVDLAAFLDRIDRAPGEVDFRLPAFKQALQQLDRSDGQRTEQVLLALSDPSNEPILAVPTRPACGAWPGVL